MTRLAGRRGTRADLLAKSALYGALTGAVGLIAGPAAQAASGGAPILPVQAPTTPQVAGGNGNQPTIGVAGSTMTVATGAARTLIDWNSFTVGQGSAVNFTFNTRSDIVLNRLVNSTPVMINGSLTGTVQGNPGGNVWFSAPGGVVFGSTAVVNVGGMLATTALVDVTSFLNPNNTSSFPFAYPGTSYPGTTGYPAGTYFPGAVTYPAGSAYAATSGYPTSNVAGGVGGVTVMSGASLTANGGLLALIAPFVNVAAGATVTSSDQTSGGGGAGSVLYGAANAFTVSLSTETSGDLDMLQFIIDSPSQVTDYPLVLQGATTGTNVYVASLSASAITGAVVDATGTLTAATASTGQGGEIILSTANDTVNAPTYAAGTFTPGSVANTQELATATADLALGSLSAGQDVQAYSSGAINGSNGVSGFPGTNLISAGSDATLNAAAGLTLDSVTAGQGGAGSINLQGASIYAGTLTAQNGAVTASANGSETNPGGAYVDIGTVEASGAVNLTANDGYLSLTNLILDGAGTQTVNLTAVDASGFGSPAGVIYFGYEQAGQGSAQQGTYISGSIYGVTGSGAAAPVNLNAANGIQTTASGDITFGTINNAQGAVNLVSSGAMTLSDAIEVGGDFSAQALNGITYQSVASDNGSVTLASLAGESSPGQGTSQYPSMGGGPVSGGDITAYNGYVDVEGTTVSVGNVNASSSATQSPSGYNIYLAAWDGNPADLNYGALNPAYSTGQVFLYATDSAPTNPPPPPPQSVTLPQQDPNSPPQNSGEGAAPTIGAPTTLGDGATGEVIDLNARRTLIDWTSYVIGSGGEVDYVFNPVAGQGAANARGNIVLNRITGGGPVDIEGTLTSSVAGDIQAYGGNVWFSAPGGVVFGSGAVVNVGGLVASTGAFSPSNLTNEFLNPNSFLFQFDGAGTGYPSGATGFPGGTGYPGGMGYPVDSSAIGVTVQGGAQINASGSLVALLAPFVSVGSDAQITDLDATGAGGSSVVYGAMTSALIDTAQPHLNGDTNNGEGSLDFAQLLFPTTLSGYATPLSLLGATQAESIYAAALAPSGAAGAANLSGALTAKLTAGGAGGEIIISTDADTIVAGQTPVPTAFAISPIDLTVDTVTAAGPLRVLSSGGVNASADPAGLLSSGGDLTLTAAGDIQLSGVQAGGGVSANSTATDQYGDVFGTGAITANTISAGGAISLQGSSVVATSLTVASTSGAAGAVTASAYDPQGTEVSGAASVDIGAISAPGQINLTANDGYASLTNVTFTGSGQALNLTAYGFDGYTGSYDPVYFGYSPGGPDSNSGKGPTPGVGSVSGSGTINLLSNGDTDLNVISGSGLVTVGSATSYQGAANLTADALTTGVVQGFSGVNATARTGDLNANELDSSAGDVNANATLGSVYLASSTANDIYVTAAQTAHVDNAVTQGYIPEDPIDVTGATAYLGTASSQDDINVTATNGSATAGDLTAAGAITVTAANGVASLHSATLGGTGYPSGTTFANTVSVSASGTGADVLIGDPLGTLATGFVTGATSITAQADEDVAVNVAQPIGLNLVSAGRNVSLTAPSLTLDSLQGALTGDLNVQVTGDAFTYANPISFGGGVSLSAADALQLDTVTAQTGALTLQGASVSAGALISGGDTLLTATSGGVTLTDTANAGGNFTAVATTTGQYGDLFGAGAITAGTIRAGGSVDLEGSSVFVSAVNAGAANGAAGTITASAYEKADDSNEGLASVDIGSATATGDINLTANAGYASLTSVTFAGAGQNLNISAYGYNNSTGVEAPVYFGYAQGGPAANNGAGPVGGAGSVTGSGTINLHTYGDADLNVANGSGLVTVGAVSSSGTANLTADALTITGVAQGFYGTNVTARTGDLNAHELDSTVGDVHANATLGSVFLANTTANDVYVVAARTAHVDNATTRPGNAEDPIDVTGATAYLGTASSQDDINVTATNGSATAGDLTAVGAITVSATNGVASLHSATLGGAGYPSGTSFANTVSVSASGTGADVLIGDPVGTLATGFVTGATSITAQADEDVAVNVARPIGLNLVSAGRNVSLTAPSLTLGSLQGTLTGQIGIDVTNAGFAYSNALTAGAGVGVSAAGAITLGDIGAGSAGISLEGASVTLGHLVSGGAISLTALNGDADVASGVAQSFLNINAQGSITSGALTAGSLSTGAGSIDLRAGLESAQSPLPNPAASINVGPLIAGDYINIISAPAGVTVASARTSPHYQSQGWVHVFGALTGPVEAPYTLSAQYLAPSPAFITIGAVSAGSGVSLASGGALKLTGSVTAGGQVSLQGASVEGGSLSAGPITSDGAGVYVDARSGAVSLGDVTSQAGTLVLTGSSVGAGALSANGAISVTADTGAIALASIASGGGVTLTAPAGAITVASTLRAGGGDATLLSGGDIMLGDVASASGNFTADTRSGGSPLGVVATSGIDAGGEINLSAASIRTGALAAQGLDANGRSITATAYDRADGANARGAFVDVASVVAPGSVTLTANDGYASLGSATLSGAGAPLTVTAGGVVYLGYQPGGLGQTEGGGSFDTAGLIDLIAGAGVHVDADGAAKFDQVVTGGPAQLTAGSISANYIQADTINVQATGGDIDLGGADALSGAATLNAPAGSISVLGGLTLVTPASGPAYVAGLISGQGVSITASGAVQVSEATTSEPTGQGYDPAISIDLSGAQVSLDRASAFGQINISASNGNASGGDLLAGSITISAVNGTASLLNAGVISEPASEPQSPRALSLSATGTNADVLLGSSPTFSRAGGQIGGALGAFSDVTLSAARDIQVQVGDAIGLDTVQAGRDLTIIADGDLTLGGTSVGRNLSLTAPSVSLASVSGQPPGAIYIDATAGGFADSAPLNANGGVTVIAAGPVALGSVTALGGSVDVSSQGAASVTAATASGDITITARGGSATLGAANLAGGGLLSVSASGATSDVILGQGGGLVQGAGRIDLQAGEDVNVAVGGPIVLASVAAGRDVTVSAAGIQAASLSSGQDTSLSSSAQVTVGAVGAGRDLSVDAAGAVVLGPSQVGRNLSLTGASVSLGGLAPDLAGSVLIEALDGGFTAPTTSPIIAAGAIDITASGAVNAGALQSSGSGVTLQGASITAGAISAAQAVDATANSGALSVANVTTPAAVALSGGSVTTGAISAGGAVTATASSGALTLAALNTSAGATLSGVGVSIPAGKVGGDLAVSSGGDAALGSVTVGGALSLDTVGLASFGSVSAKGTGQITAGTVDIATLLSAPTLTLEARNGALTVGGSSAPADGSMWISEAEFGRLSATTSLDLYAGSTTGTARGALVISDLSLDPSLTPKVNFYAAPGQTVSVTGTVAPTTSGGSLAIGSTTDAAWTPSTILISGSLGAATRVTDAKFTGVRAFQQVTLSSAGDVLIGSPRFFALIQATPAAKINIALDQPSGVMATGSEVGKVFVAAGQLSIDAAGKVVQQNSSGSATSYSGLYLLNGLSTARTALSIDPPSVVDLFGSFVNGSGVLTDGAQASRATGLQILGLVNAKQVPDDYRFNGCTISPSAVCGVVVGPEQGVQLMEDQEEAAIAAATTDPQVLIQSILLTVPPTAEAEQQVDPLVTGVGNEEIWRKRTGSGKERDDR